VRLTKSPNVPERADATGASNGALIVVTVTSCATTPNAILINASRKFKETFDIRKSKFQTRNVSWKLLERITRKQKKLLIDINEGLFRWFHVGNALTSYVISWSHEVETA
jgi:hypothetical protein